MLDDEAPLINDPTRINSLFWVMCVYNRFVRHFRSTNVIQTGRVIALCGHELSNNCKQVEPVYNPFGKLCRELPPACQLVAVLGHPVPNCQQRVNRPYT